MTGKRTQTSPAGSPNSGNNFDKDLDRFLPIANVSRIMKKSLPANAKISKEAKETVQECVSEFISFITGEASDKCQREKRKTINGDDLLWAMTTLGFENYVSPLKIYLSKYRDIEVDKIGSPTTELHQRFDDNVNDGGGDGGGGYYAHGAQVNSNLMGSGAYNKIGDGNRVIPTTQFIMGSSGRF